MEAALSIASLAVLAFAATNFDNLLLLVAMLARSGQTVAPIFGGTLLAGGTMLSLCAAAALAASFAPQAWVGLLGLVPLGLGLRELYRLLQRRGEDALEADSAAKPISALGVAGVMLANSADSFGALVPLFAETQRGLQPAIAFAVLATSLLGCLLARWIATHERVGPAIRRIGPVLVPFVLIAVGLYVLSDTPTDAFIARRRG